MAKRKPDFRKDGNKFQARKGIHERTSTVISKPFNVDSIRSNDIAWYNKHPDAFKTATQAPTWWKVYGLDTDLGKIIDSTDSVESILPVGMRIEFVPGPGTCSTQNDGVNRAFATLMADLYAKSSSSSLPFQQADLAMLTFSIDSIATLIAQAKRGLGFADNWITTNKYYPIGVLKLMGFDYYDVQNNRADYITKLNSLIYRFNSLRFPDRFDVLHRHYALAHNVYADEDSSFAQLYVFSPSGFWKYSDTESKCVWNKIPYGESFSMGVLLDTIGDLLDALFNSSDLYLINGALQRAYGEGTFTQISKFVDGENVSPVVDRTIMGQVMNMDIVGELDVNEITQDPTQNVIKWLPQQNGTTGSYEFLSCISNSRIGASHFMVAYDSTVTPDDNMEFTRLCNTTYATDEGIVFQAGTEIITKVVIQSGDSLQVTLDTNFIDKSAVAIYQLAAVMPFRYLPPIYLTGIQADGQTGRVTLNGMARIGDIYNYTILSEEDLNKLNQVAMYSIWA